MQRLTVTSIRAGIATFGVGAITLLCSRLLPVNAATTGFFYLILILAVATLWGLVEAIVASAAAMLCYNFFFLPPVGHFTIADPQNWVALFTFLVTALVASHLSDRAKNQTLEAKRRQRETEQLYALSRAILLTDATQPIGSQAAQHIAQIFTADVVLFDSSSGATFFGGTDDLPGVEPILKQVVLQGASHHNASTMVDTWPIALGGRPVGALAAKGIHLSDSAVQALLNLVAIAFERVRAEEATNKAEVARQSEEFKSTLLDAIAHEFKTPLTSIKVASSSLLAEGDSLNAERREMLSIIDEETDRMSLLVTEAVKMAQIDAGKVKLDRSATSIETLLRSAVSSFSGRGDDRIQGLDNLEAMPLILVDPEMVSLAIRQIIDNALKYSPPPSPILLRADSEPGRVVIRVIDQGPGIPERDREKIFDKFYRRSSVRDKVPGTGLGLHIAREIVRAHAGDMWVEEGPNGGSQFCLALPRYMVTKS
jgi:two-component system, OmpR family, sensor histidine kinase KdpD